MIERLWMALGMASFRHAQARRSHRTLRWQGFRFSHLTVEMAEQNGGIDIEQMHLTLPDQIIVIEGQFPRSDDPSLGRRFVWIDRPTDENFVMLQLLL